VSQFNQERAHRNEPEPAPAAAPIIRICVRLGLYRHDRTDEPNGGYLKSPLDNAWWAGISAA
jgi:hypothetical protein